MGNQESSIKFEEIDGDETEGVRVEEAVCDVEEVNDVEEVEEVNDVNQKKVQKMEEDFVVKVNPKIGGILEIPTDPKKFVPIHVIVNDPGKVKVDYHLNLIGNDLSIGWMATARVNGEVLKIDDRR